MRGLMFSKLFLPSILCDITCHVPLENFNIHRWENESESFASLWKLFCYHRSMIGYWGPQGLPDYTLRVIELIPSGKFHGHSVIGWRAGQSEGGHPSLATWPLMSSSVPWSSFMVLCKLCRSLGLCDISCEIRW
jgi:hypothetical protein